MGEIPPRIEGFNKKIWSLGEDISAKDNNVRMIGVNSEWVILVNHIQFAVGEKPCTTKRE